MLPRLIVVAIALSLCGCVEQRQRAAAEASEDERACNSYGSQLGSQAYFNCRVAARETNRSSMAGEPAR
jgi:hypothetical protein